MVTAKAVSKAERAEPFVLNPIGLAIIGPFIPGRMGDATCDNGNCNKMSARTKKPSGKPSGKTGEDRPPAGSKGIDETKWSGDHGEIKGSLGLGGADDVKISPSGDVWSQNPDGSWTNQGPAGNFTGSGSASGQSGSDRESNK